MTKRDGNTKWKMSDRTCVVNLIIKEAERIVTTVMASQAGSNTPPYRKSEHSSHDQVFLAFTCSIIGPIYNSQVLRMDAAQPWRQMLISSRCIESAYTNLIT